MLTLKNVLIHRRSQEGDLNIFWSVCDLMTELAEKVNTKRREEWTKKTSCFNLPVHLFIISDSETYEPIIQNVEHKLDYIPRKGENFLTENFLTEEKLGTEYWNQLLDLYNKNEENRNKNNKKEDKVLIFDFTVTVGAVAACSSRLEEEVSDLLDQITANGLTYNSESLIINK